MSDAAWSFGWTFYKTGLVGKPPADIDPVELKEWMKGFCAAIADYDLDCRHPSIQAALLHYGIDGDLLEDCLKTPELIIDEPAFCRWPSAPVRGYGT